MTAENTQIRPITATDDAAMGAIAQASLAANGLDIPGTAYFDPELFHLSAFCGEKPEARGYYVAVNAQGTVIGGAGFAEFPVMEKTAELQKLYLADGAKGHGLGTRLVHFVEDAASDHGYTQLYLETHSNLQPAIHLYEKLGYRRIEKPPCVGHATMDHFYLKRL